MLSNSVLRRGTNLKNEGTNHASRFTVANFYRLYNPLATRCTCVSWPIVFILLPIIVQLNHTLIRTRPTPTNNIDIIVFRIMITELNIIFAVLASLFSVP
jgi:hypothetical protein